MNIVRDRIKILSAAYDKETQLVQLLVRRSNGDKNLFCFPSSDLHLIVPGIPKDLPDEAVYFFCKEFTNKEMNWESSVEHKKIEDVDLHGLKKVTEDMNKMAADLNDKKITPEEYERELDNKLKSCKDVLDKYGNAFDNYPIYEVLKLLEKEGIYQDTSYRSKQIPRL